ncbi:FxsA family protein [Lysinibacillus piscis]|uniref:UPF0716 protein YtzA n=1 Tax=Lysinibacillus piscis TaxID=2518931 RepID=A0ABQ5NJR1_9BACI|nr:FxsA family protein [Lysinibacillus sp. KH24]GLC88311.1 UPF0716 protein YtzA [Lysinibacillus sp. KH24]
MRKIVFGFLGYVLLELALLIVVGKLIGVLPTLLLVVATSVLGIYVVKNKGMNSVRSVKQALENREAPGTAMVDTMLNFSGGFLLALPGFLTDVLGVLLLMPISRKLFQPIVYYWMRKKMKHNQVIIVQK